jgi:RHS repeat-associated protein
MRALNSRSRLSIWRIPYRAGISIGLCLALVVSGLPTQALRFVQTGTWAAGDSVAYAAVTTTTRVSLTHTGAQLNADAFTWPDGWPTRNISNDGRYVVFVSNATNLPGNSAGGTNVFVRDSQLATTTLVSANTSGAAAGGGRPTISGDGRYVAFLSSAAEVVSGDTNGVVDIFVRDLTLAMTVRASVDSGGIQGSAASDDPYLSADGHFVVFVTDSNFGGPAPGGGIYLRDLVLATTEFISIGRDGAVANDFSNQPSVSDDGRFVSFVSRASNLSPIPKTNLSTIFDVYLRDRTAGTTTRVSVGPGGVQGNAQSNTAVVATDGSVVFRSGAENLVSNDGNFLVDLFLRAGGLTLRVAEDSHGGSITGDGRFIVFYSAQSNLVPGDTNGFEDTFLRDQQEGTTELISQSSLGAIGNSGGWRPSVSADGRYVAFDSSSTNLVSGDTNGFADIFVRDRGPVDSGAAAPYTYGDDPNGAYTPEFVNVGTGVYTTASVDLTMPGRILPFVFRRVYNSADTTSGPFGPAWSHSYLWKLADAGSVATVRRGDGQRDRFTRNVDGTYTPPPNVFDTLVKNGDSTFTLTLKNQTKFDLTSAGQLTRISEPAGNQVNLTYTSGNLTTITDTVGRAVTLSYDTSNRVTQLQDPLGRKVTYAYDSNGRLATVTDKIGNAAGQVPTQHQWKYAYDGSSQHLTTITDPDARVRITNTYDANGRVYQQRDGLNQLTTITYNPTETVTVDARNNSSTQTYDTRKRALVETRVVSGQTLTLNYVYDASGNLTSVTDRNGKTTDYTYDTRGNALTKTAPQVDPLVPRYLTQFAYDAKNNLFQIIDARNFVTTRTFDATTNVLLSESKQIDATISAVTKFEYNDSINKGMATRVIAPRGNLTGTPDYAYAINLTYASGNLMTRVDPDGATTTFAYDSAGRQITFVDPDGNVAGSSSGDHTWAATYDENDQLKTQTDPAGGFLAYGYDGAGNQTGSTDRNGNLTTYVYDANSRLFKVQQKPDPVGNPALVYTTQIDSDPNGNAIHVTQANGVVTDHSYDELDRLTSYSTHPSGSSTLTTTVSLDGNGNALTKTTPPGADQQITTSTYDAMSRLKTVDAVGLTTIAYQYDATSNRTQMTDETGTTTYQYDGLGRLTQAAQPNGTLNYGYDRDGNRTSLVYPAAADTVTYVYTNGGRLDHLTDAAGRTSTYTYTASGLAKTLAAPNGLTTSYQFDRAQRLTSVANLVGTNMRTRHTYTLDKQGNRVALDEFVEGITATPSTTWSASVKVNSDTGTTVQDHPSVALGADGAHYLVWDDARDGNASIYFSKRDPATGVWSSPSTKVNTDTGSRIQLNPSIALDSSSNAYAVWQDERNGAGKPDIYFRKRTAAGTWVSPDVKVNNDAGGGGGAIQRNPRIAGTAAGAETAVWVDLRSSQNNIWSSQLSVGGSTWAANKQVTDNTAAVKDFPDVTVGLDGTAYAVWQDSRNGNADIYFSKLPPGAIAWTANVKVSDDPGTAIQRLARIGVDATGNLTVVWLDDRTSPAKIRMSRLQSGTSTWPASTVVADAAARPVSVALSVRADGKAYVAFGDNRVANIEIYGSEYDPWLNSWTTSALVSDDPGSAAQQSPTVAYGISEIVAAWRDDRAGNADVRARRATLTGTDHFGLGYDGLERLTGITVTSPESFVLDAASNISSRTGPSATNTYDTANRLLSDGTQSYVWSQSDRLIGRGTDVFGYDSLDRLKSSTVGGVARTYTYNGTGLVQSRVQGTAVTFLWDAGTSPSRLLQVGGDRLIHGMGPIYAVKADASTTTFARDGGKSIRAELNSTGGVTASFRYRAYGQVAQSSGSATPNYLGYAGQLPDPSGLYYMRARWYDPSTGRFLSRDPAAGNSLVPASLNAFAYAHASPTMNTDPTGQFVFAAVLLWVALPTISTGAVIAWTAAAAGFGVLVYAATHDDVFRAEAKPVERKYEDIEKHGKKARMGPKGIISKRPTNGPGALENSEPVPGKDRQRVGTDPDTGEEVQLRRHGEVDAGDRIVETWHGWVSH